MNKAFRIASVVWKEPPTQPKPLAGHWEVSVDFYEYEGLRRTRESIVRERLEAISGGTVAHFHFVEMPAFYMVNLPEEGAELADVFTEYPISVSGIQSVICQGRGGLDETKIALITTKRAEAMALAKKLLAEQKRLSTKSHTKV